MKENRKLCEMPSLDLSSACRIAEQWKDYFENHGYENVLFSIQETNLSYRFRVEVWGSWKED